MHCGDLNVKKSKRDICICICICMAYMYYVWGVCICMGYMYMHDRFILLYSRNEHSIVKQLYSNKN